MKRVLDLIKFEKDRITKAKEIVQKASEFEKCIRGGKETRLKFMGELYDSETILNRLEEQVNLLIEVDKEIPNHITQDVTKPLGYAEWDNEKEEQPQLFKELTIDDIIKGLGKVLQPVPTKNENSYKEAIEELKRKEEIDVLRKKAIRNFKYPPRVFDKGYYDKKYCKVLCDMVVNDKYKPTFGKVFEVERENPYEVVVYLDGVMVNVPKEYVTFM